MLNINPKLHIDLSKARELVALSVADRGEDYIYPYDDCVNVLQAGTNYSRGQHGGYDVFPEDKPGCLVGDALHKAGIPLERMSSDSDAGGTLVDLEFRGMATHTREAKEWLMFLQNEQDSKRPWGQAVRDADRFIEESN